MVEAGARAYLKVDLEFSGVPVPAIRALVASWSRARPGLGRGELTAMAGALWARPLYECRQAAVILLERRAGLLEAADIAVIERLLRTSRTWGLLDGLAAHGAGMEDIVKVTVYVTDIRAFNDIADIRSRYFPEDGPSSVICEIKALAWPEFLIEVDAVAVVP